MLTHGASLLAAVLAGVLELTAAVHAQAPSATVQGTAIDESAAIVPGVRVTVEGMTAASSTNPGQFSVNGQRQNANNLTVDGVSANVAVTVERNALRGLR